MLNRLFSVAILMAGTVAAVPLASPQTFTYEPTGASLTIVTETDGLDEESRGEDRYFIWEDGGIHASVLFYRLTEEEYWTNRLMATNLGVTADNSVMALGSFAARSRARPYESQEYVLPGDPFSYRDVNVEYTPDDSVRMAAMIASVAKGK